MVRFLSAAALAALTLAAVSMPAIAEVPTASVCKSFAKHAIRWNTEVRRYGCKLPPGANFHFDEGRIYKWCMGRPNDNRSPQALGHKDLLRKACPRYQRAS